MEEEEQETSSGLRGSTTISVVPSSALGDNETTGEADDREDGVISVVVPVGLCSGDTSVIAFSLLNGAVFFDFCPAFFIFTNCFCFE